MLLRKLFPAVLLAIGSLPAQAAVTGQVGAASDYLFRGLDYSSGMLVQGGLQYAAPNGAYSGANMRNCSSCGGSEARLYAGWAGKLGQVVGVDAGVQYYLYSESEQNNNGHLSYLETHLGANAYGLSADFYYAPSYRGAASVGGGNRDGYYAALSYRYAIDTSLHLTGHFGYSWGDGLEQAVGDKYSDYSVTLSKQLDNDFAMQVAVVDTDLKGFLPSGAKYDDKPKVVVGLNKQFSF